MRIDSKYLKGKERPERRKYSRNPEDWIGKCKVCEYDIIYDNFTAYKGHIYRLKMGGTFCKVCLKKHRSELMTGFKFSDEAKQNMSKSAKNRNTSSENELTRRRGTSEGLKKWYSNLTPEEREDLHQRQRAPLYDMPHERRLEWYAKVSTKRKEEMQRNGCLDVFKPSYNKNTISYIINDLSNEYNTTFIHAESENGEYRIYDAIEKKSYYADAYSEELNLWIEFDEVGKFKFENNLKAEHQIRHERIINLLNCKIFRYKIYKDVDNTFKIRKYI